LPPVDGDTHEDRVAIVSELVHWSNGQPTLVQMQQFAELVMARRASPLPAAVYKQIFMQRVMALAGPRLEAVRAGIVPRERWMVPGARELLEALGRRGIPCYLVSGTDDSIVREDIAVLGLGRLFAGIVGATPDPSRSSKAAVFRRIARERSLGEGEMVAFGDGSEEVRLAKEMGGLAIALAHDGAGSPGIDAEQRMRLIAAGADAIVADLQPCDAIMDYLFDSARTSAG
ncbi:MAG: HAD family hydrolase, partial [Rudaea sp.]